MPSEFRFHELIEAPFGPYSDYAILSPTFPPPGFRPTLECLTLERGNEWIGLDDSEFILPPPADHPTSRNDIFFYGTLRIESLHWLSEEGLNRLETELRLRDQQLHQIPESQLSLVNLYGDARDRGSRVSVILECKKNMYVEYMTSDRDKSSFIIQSVPRDGDTVANNRQYNVVSLDGPMHEKSRNFMMCYRLWALIKKLTETDEEKTPLHQRTVPWLVQATVKRLRFFDDPEFRGIVTHRDDGEEEVTSEEEDQVRGVFAGQAEWLLAQQLAPQHRNHWLVNMKKWVQFCSDIQSTRKKAIRNGVRWGLPFGETRVTDDSLHVRLSKFGGTPRFWKEKLDSLELAWAKIEKEAAQAENDDDLTIRPPLSPEIPVFQYDPDFSDDSTPPDSDSEDSCPADLASRVPSFCWYPPAIPPGRFIWNCPGCDYSINFLHINHEDMDILPQNLRELISRKQWQSIHDQGVQESFMLLVNHHYTGHLHRNGVQMVKRRDKWFLEPYGGRRSR